MAAATTDRRLRYRIWAMVCRTPLHRLRLLGRRPRGLSLMLEERWPGDPEQGQAILAGRYRFHDETVKAAEPPWNDESPSLEWRAALHGFAWLADLAALANETAVERVRTLLESWTESQARWHPLVWRADVTGERLHSWLAWAELLAPAEGDVAVRAAFLESIARQTRHLRRAASWEVTGIERLQALKGLLAASLALGLGDAELDRVLRLIEREANAQILPDGGHTARSPSLQAAALRHLIDARSALNAARVEVPAPLQAAIDRAAPMLRFFRHGDARLALFNDSTEQQSAYLDLVLARSECKGRPPASAPMTGFERLHTGKSIVIVDCGAPAADALGGHPHAGTLAFEMSYGRERLIVNCGAYRGSNEAWHAAMRTTAAHSTLVVADAPSSELDETGHLTRRLRHVTRERAEQDGSQFVAASHDGYKGRFGLVHARQLFLATDGDDLRGEDRLTGPPGQGFTVRFHLHPQVQASLIQDGSAALLRLPSGAGWRLRAQGAVMSLAESVYLGGGDVKKTQQIVLQGHVGTQGATVKWAVRREGK
ncbi:MAG TPA: heparinase II/III family protein [Stellaceae bacterium]|nr:heparinase II/III family protein [Stellaceae bacterium]